MTLNTDIYVLDEIDPRAVFEKAQALLGPRPDGKPTETSTDNRHGYVSLDNEPQQGLPAWLMMRYREGAPLATEEGNAAELAEHLASGDHTWCNVPESRYYEASEPDNHDSFTYELNRPCWLSLDFDTAYGYRDAQGRDCNSLHAGYIRQLGAWFDSLGVRWAWRNEYTGEIHSGYDGLAEFAHDGEQAQGWFVNEAAPAIAAMIAGGQ